MLGKLEDMMQQNTTIPHAFVSSALRAIGRTLGPANVSPSATASLYDMALWHISMQVSAENTAISPRDLLRILEEHTPEPILVEMAKRELLKSSQLMNRTTAIRLAVLLSNCFFFVFTWGNWGTETAKIDHALSAMKGTTWAAPTFVATTNAWLGYQFQIVQVCESFDTYRLLAFGTGLMYLREFMVIFASHPRVALLIKTIEHAGSDFIHFFITSALIIVSMSFLGVVQFGTSDPLFADMPHSLNTLCQLLMGEFGGEAKFELWLLTSTSRMVFVVIYVFVVVFFLLNFLLAIIVNQASKATQSAAEAGA